MNEERSGHVLSSLGAPASFVVAPAPEVGDALRLRRDGALVLTDGEEREIATAQRDFASAQRDAAKAARNYLKHRVRFEEAVECFLDERSITAPDMDEERFVLIGRSHGLGYSSSCLRRRMSASA